jgi:hypothetical protein
VALLHPARTRHTGDKGELLLTRLGVELSPGIDTAREPVSPEAVEGSVDTLLHVGVLPHDA